MPKLELTAAVLVALVAGCGDDPALRPVVACAADLQCPIGQVCAPDQSGCLDVQSEGLAAYPPPTDSGTLYQRFGRIDFDAMASSGVQQVRFGGDEQAAIDQTLIATDLHARVTLDAGGARVEVWGLVSRSTGGAITLWPMTREPLVVLAPIQSTETLLLGEAHTALALGAYPAAEFTTTVPVAVTTQVGQDADNTLALTTRFDTANLHGVFAVEDGRVTLRLQLEAHLLREGPEAYLRVQDLSVQLTLFGNEVPAAWL